MCLHYLVKLIAWVLSPYIKFYTIFNALVRDALAEFFNICNLPLVVDPFLHDSPYRIVDGVKIRTIGRPQTWLDEIRCDFFQQLNVLISALSTAQWRSGENDCERVPLLKEDSLKMNCDSWCNSVVATMHCDFAFNRLTAYNICRECFQCSLTLWVTCSRCEAL